MAKTRLIQGIEPQMLHQTGGFRGQVIYWCLEIYIRPTPVAMATKIWEFWLKIG